MYIGKGRRLPGCLKCNIDASLCYVHVGEALGLFHAIEWLSDMQMDNVGFVVDSKTTNDSFHSN